MTTWNGTLPAWLVGEDILAADLATMTDVLAALTEAWTSYTPAWTASGTAPALGNGTLVGRWRRLGKTVDVCTTLTMGSTSTFGTGAYFISLPVAARSLSPRAIGAGWTYDASANSYKEGVALVETNLARVEFASNGVQIGPGSPMAWANLDILAFSLTYEVA